MYVLNFDYGFNSNKRKKLVGIGLYGAPEVDFVVTISFATNETIRAAGTIDTHSLEFILALIKFLGFSSPNHTNWFQIQTMSLCTNSGKKKICFKMGCRSTKRVI